MFTALPRFNVILVGMKNGIFRNEWAMLGIFWISFFVWFFCFIFVLFFLFRFGFFVLFFFFLLGESVYIRNEMKKCDGDEANVELTYLCVTQ